MKAFLSFLGGDSLTKDDLGRLCPQIFRGTVKEKVFF